MTPGAQLATELGIPIDDEAGAPAEPKFTQGEWKIKPRKPHHRLIEIDPAGVIVDMDVAGKPAEANANLIAAAPKLYAACELLLAGIAIQPYAKENKRLMEAVVDAYFALKKARGE